MKSSNPILAIVALVGAATAHSNATVIFEDTFASRTGSWFRASSLDSLSNTAGELTVVRNTVSPTSTDGVIGRSFEAQSLAL